MKNFITKPRQLSFVLTISAAIQFCISNAASSTRCVLKRRCTDSCSDQCIDGQQVIFDGTVYSSNVDLTVQPLSSITLLIKPPSASMYTSLCAPNFYQCVGEVDFPCYCKVNNSGTYTFVVNYTQTDQRSNAAIYCDWNGVREGTNTFPITGSEIEPCNSSGPTTPKPGSDSDNDLAIILGSVFAAIVVIVVVIVVVRLLIKKKNRRNTGNTASCDNGGESNNGTEIANNDNSLTDKPDNKEKTEEKHRRNSVSPVGSTHYNNASPSSVGVTVDPI